MGVTEGARRGGRRRRGVRPPGPARVAQLTRPIVDRELYRENRLFVAACAAALLVYAGVFAAGLLTAVDLQVVQGLGAGATGVILLIAARHDGDPRACGGALVRPHRITRADDDRGQPSWHWALWCSRPWDPRIRGHAPSRGWPSSASVSVSSARPTSRQFSARLSEPAERGLRRAGDQPLRRSSAVGVHPGVHRRVVARRRGWRHPVRADHCNRGGTSAFHDGFRSAMVVGAGIALLAALVSSRRGPQTVTSHACARSATARRATPGPDSRTSTT